jgi:hypothetical protein
MKTSLRHAAKPRRRSPPYVNDRRRPKAPFSGEHPRRRFLSLAAGAAALPAVSRIARAQAFPSRPITMITPFTAGGLLDTLARILAERMRQSLGQPVIVENVTGADGSIGLGRTARARPDGYTIVVEAIRLDKQRAPRLDHRGGAALLRLRLVSRSKRSRDDAAAGRLGRPVQYQQRDPMAAPRSKPAPSRPDHRAAAAPRRHDDRGRDGGQR